VNGLLHLLEAPLPWHGHPRRPRVHRDRRRALLHRPVRRTRHRTTGRTSPRPLREAAVYLRALPPPIRRRQVAGPRPTRRLRPLLREVRKLNGIILYYYCVTITSLLVVQLSSCVEVSFPKNNIL
jgi:hypothetical protein